MVTRILTAALVVAAVGGAARPAAAQVSGSLSSIFINEFHYDNVGADTGEAIEVALPTGTDISGLSVVLYNGNGGAVYDTKASSAGTLTVGANGFSFLTINYPSNGIQNGSPDGIALANNGALIQFLSYEGAFVGVGGVADGVTSVDIGVFETGTEPAGLSLQLGGTGSTYGAFAWQTNGDGTSGMANTFGAVNLNQTFVPVPEPGTILGLAAAGLGVFGFARRRLVG